MYLFEIKRDFLDRTVYWFISLFLFPSGKQASVWAESVESRGNAPALWTRQGQFEMRRKEALKGEKNCLRCQGVTPRSNANSVLEKHDDSKWTILWSLYYEFLDTTVFWSV